MKVTICTLFPEFFRTPLESSLLGRAISSGTIQVELCDIRQFGEGKYKAVDDRPYGGGAGMVMMAPVLERALESFLGADGLLAAKQSVQSARSAGVVNQSDGPHIVFLSPQGKVLSAALGRSFAEQLLQNKNHLVLICGHYEGIDERFIETYVHQEISIGDYVLTGGEPAALVLLDVLSRFVPGVVGTEASVSGDTFETTADDMIAGGLKYPMYTRPAEWQDQKIPEVLTSGNHAEINKWRKNQSSERTKKRRPDLLTNAKSQERKK